MIGDGLFCSLTQRCYGNWGVRFPKKMRLTTSHWRNGKKPDALKDMFVENFHAIKRLVLRIPDNYPTHPQAEVLVFDRVPAQYLNSGPLLETKRL